MNLLVIRKDFLLYKIVPRVARSIITSSVAQDDANDRIVVCTDRTDLKTRRQTKCLGYARLLIRADACA